MSSKWIQENLTIIRPISVEKKKMLKAAWANISKIQTLLENRTEIQYHCFPEPSGPPAKIMKSGTILAAGNSEHYAWPVHQNQCLFYNVKQTLKEYSHTEMQQTKNSMILSKSQGDATQQEKIIKS